MLAGIGLTSVTIAASGPASAAAAWQGYADLDRWATWAPQIRGVDARERSLRAGLTGHVRGPAGVRIAFTVQDVDERHRRWTWRVGLGPARIRLVHGIDEQDDGCRAWLVMHVPPLLAAPYLPVAWYALHTLVGT